MLEIYPVAERLTAVGMAASLTFSGAPMVEESQYADLGYGPKIERCLEEPLEAAPVAASSEALDLTQKDSQSKAAEDPSEPSLMATVAATSNVVEITVDDRADITPDRKGSGFITEIDGKQVVVTAAHVIGTAALSQVKVVELSGHAVEPTDGCYVYDQPGKHIRLIPNRLGSAATLGADVAVLSLPEKLSTQPLAIANTDPKPGDNLGFINFQQGFGPKNSLYPGDTSKEPASYSGVVMPTAQSPLNLDVLTGIYPSDDDRPNANTIIQGASGGAVLNQQGEIAAVSYAVTYNEATGRTSQNTIASYNVILDDGSSQDKHRNVAPRIAHSVPASTLRHILQGAVATLATPATPSR